MHERVLAERKAIAQGKIVSFSALIAQKQGLPFDTSSLTVTNKDPELQSLFRMEAVADFMKSLAQKLEIEMPVVETPQAEEEVKEPEAVVPEEEAPQVVVKEVGKTEEVKVDISGRKRRV